MNSEIETKELVLTALFSAIIIIMAFTPFGYIPLGIINATIIQIPVIIGTLFCGPKKGAFLGFLFGFTSCLRSTVTPASLSAFVFSPVLAANMFGPKGLLFSTIICFVPRILVGIIPYYIYKGAKKCSNGKTLPFALAGVVGSLTNTFLVMGLIYFLYKDAYAAAQGIDPATLLGVVAGIIGFNGGIEAVLSGGLVSALGVVLVKIKPVR